MQSQNFPYSLVHQVTICHQEKCQLNYVNIFTELAVRLSVCCVCHPAPQGGSNKFNGNIIVYVSFVSLHIHDCVEK